MSNLIPFRTQGVRQEPSDLKVKIETYERVIRCIGAHLSSNELVVLLHIVDRVNAWGKTEASFSLSAFRNGDKVNHGFPAAMSRSTMFTTLASLEKKGLINRRPDANNKDKRHYSVNLDWTGEPHSSAESEARAGSGSRTTQSATRTRQSGSRTLYTSNQVQVIETSSRCAPASRAAVIEPNENKPEDNIPVRSARSHAAAAASTKVMSHKTNATSGIACDEISVAETVWRNAVRETFPGVPVPAWQARERGQAKNAMKLWHRSGVTFNDFLDWSARNWTAIMAKQFRWMTKAPPPTVPAIPFFHSFLSQFKECYAERKLEDWLDRADRTEIDKIMARGATYEEAMHELAQRKAAAGLRDEMEKREAEVRLQSRVAKIRLDKAERLEKIGEAPPHPKSPLAQRLMAEARRRAPVPQPTTISGPDPDFPEVMVPFVDPAKNPFD